MFVYGVDFSGARDPSGKIYVASGRLSQANGEFELLELSSCDDRLDLFSRFLGSEKDSIWGLDVPFAPAGPAYEEIGFHAWEEWLEFAASHSRQEFMQKLDTVFTPYEGPCRTYGWACRHTDIACAAASPLKRVNPNLRAMIYGGWKWLAYARRQGASVFPFDSVMETSRGPRIYEVYPSHTARTATERRTMSLTDTVGFFMRREMFRAVEVPARLKTLPNQDAADACVACLTLAAVYSKETDALSGRGRPAFATEAEWSARQREGLIVRLSST